MRRDGRRASARVGGVGQRDEHEEQHQELGVAEVVFEHARRRASRPPRRAPPAASDGSDDVLRSRPEVARAAITMNQSQIAERRQAALGGDLQRHVVQVRVALA